MDCLSRAEDSARRKARVIWILPALFLFPVMVTDWCPRLPLGLLVQGPRLGQSSLLPTKQSKAASCAEKELISLPSLSQCSRWPSYSATLSILIINRLVGKLGKGRTFLPGLLFFAFFQMEGVWPRKMPPSLGWLASRLLLHIAFLMSESQEERRKGQPSPKILGLGRRSKAHEFRRVIANHKNPNQDHMPLRCLLNYSNRIDSFMLIYLKLSWSF